MNKARLRMVFVEEEDLDIEDENERECGRCAARVKLRCGWGVQDTKKDAFLCASCVEDAAPELHLAVLVANSSHALRAMRVVANATHEELEALVCYLEKRRREAGTRGRF